MFGWIIAAGATTVTLGAAYVVDTLHAVATVEDAKELDD